MWAGTSLQKLITGANIPFVTQYNFVFYKKKTILM